MYCKKLTDVNHSGAMVMKISSVEVGVSARGDGCSTPTCVSSGRYHWSYCIVMDLANARMCV